MNSNDAARTVSLALGRSPYSPGTSRLAADLERTETVTTKHTVSRYATTHHAKATKGGGEA